MLQDEKTIKLHAAGYDEGDADEVIDLDSLDEEEEFNIVSSNHAEEVELFAAPSTPVIPYEPPTRLSAEPTPSIPAPIVHRAPKKVPAKRAVKKSPAKKTSAKKAAKTSPAKKAPAKKTASKKAAKKSPAKKTLKKAPAKKKAAGKKISSSAAKSTRVLRGGKAAPKKAVGNKSTSSKKSTMRGKTLATKKAAKKAVKKAVKKAPAKKAAKKAVKKAVKKAAPKKK
jgi:hypothetical protein